MGTNRLAILLALISLSLIGCVLSQPADVEPSLQASRGPSAGGQPIDTTPTSTPEADVTKPTSTPTEQPTEAPVPLPELLAPAVFSIPTDPPGFDPSSITADWENLWVGSASQDRIVKVRPSDGQVLQVVDLGETGTGVTDLVFDGANVWALVADSVIKVRDDEVLASYQLIVDPAGFAPANLAFDGGTLWVGGGNRDIALQVITSNGQILRAIELGKPGVGVSDLALEGEHMWVLVGDAALKINFVEGQVVGTYALSFDDKDLDPLSISFDGESIWIGDRHRDIVVKVRPSDGQVLQAVPIAEFGSGVRDLACDGENVWALVSSYVVKFRASDGEILGGYDVGPGAARLRYDGTYIWITNPESGTLIRF